MALLLVAGLLLFKGSGKEGVLERGGMEGGRDND